MSKNNLSINFNNHYKYDLNVISKRIEKELKTKILEFHPIRNIYSSSVNNFIVLTENRDEYFLRLEKSESLDSEIKGNLLLGKYFRVPKILLTADRTVNNPTWLLTEYNAGTLMSEYFLKEEKNRAKSNLDELVAMEIEKEEELIKSYKQHKLLTKEELKKSIGHKLFAQRVLGSRIKEFYSVESTVGAFLNYKFKINGKLYDYTLMERLNEIKRKLEEEDFKHYKTYFGHNDAHHGNIILEHGTKGAERFIFIDCEYADYVTPLQDLTKPYYNDFIGIYFFYFPNFIRAAVKNVSINIDNEKEIVDINLDINKNFLDFRARIAEAKIKVRKNYLEDDFLNMSDYLLIAHMLTKNPNHYPIDIQIIFLVFAYQISEMDYKNPSSLLRNLNWSFNIWNSWELSKVT